jgi:hypothetical protein
MRVPTFVWIIAVAMYGARLGASAADAEDQIKAGNWESTTQVPGVTQLPPGMQPQAGVQVGPSGMTMSRTECISSDNPLPPMAPGPSAPRDASHPCKIDKTDVSGGTVRWSTTCATADTTVHVERVVHYNGEALDGEFTVRTMITGRSPIDRSQQLTGRYLGPCGDK